MTKIQKVTFYVLQTLLSIAFILAALPKVVGDPTAVAGFVQDHLPIWFMYFIGACEILGAIGLWVRKTHIYAAIGLWIILAGAAITTVIFANASMALIPVVYAMILAIIVWLGKKRDMVAMPTSPQTPPVSPMN